MSTSAEMHLDNGVAGSEEIGLPGTAAVVVGDVGGGKGLSAEAWSQNGRTVGMGTGSGGTGSGGTGTGRGRGRWGNVAAVAAEVREKKK